MDSLRQTIDWLWDDIVRGIIEVTSKHGGRASYDVVASELKSAAHCPDFKGEGKDMLDLIMKEYQSIFDGFIVHFDVEKTEFYIVD